MCSAEAQNPLNLCWLMWMMLLVSTVIHVCSQSYVIALEDITEGCACSSSGQSEERQEITYYSDLVTKDA